MSFKDTIYLPAGYALTLVSDAGSLGTYVQLGNPGGTIYTPAALAISTTVVLGPFNDDRIYQINSTYGHITNSQVYSGVLTAVDDASNALLAPKASPTFTGTVVIPTPFTLGAVSVLPTGTELNFVDGVTSAIQTQLDGKQASISGASLSSATVAGDDKVLIQDTSNANNLKSVTAQSIADLVIDSTVAATKEDVLSGASLSSASVAADDKVLIQDTSDSNNLKTITTQAIADLFDDSDKQDIVNTTNIGTAATGVTAVESGDGGQHTTVLTVSSVLPAIAGGADAAVGKLLYTLPAGACIVNMAYMSMSINQTESNINADTPDVGLGTTIGSGANALLSDVGAAAENILTGQTAADCAGLVKVKTVADQVLVIEAGGDHTIYFNAADGWAADGDSAAVLAGTVVLHWQFMH